MRASRALFSATVKLGDQAKVPWQSAKEQPHLKQNPSERMIYLSDMDQARKTFYKELREAFEVYFNAATSSMGQSESDTLMVIVEDHVEHYFPDDQEAYGSGSTSLSHPGITLVDGEGINVAYSYGDVLESDLLKGLTMESRIELLEACIYALNTRLNNLDQHGEDEAGG